MALVQADVLENAALSLREHKLPESYDGVLLDAYGVATGRDFDADLDIQGWFFGAGIKF